MLNLIGFIAIFVISSLALKYLSKKFPLGGLLVGLGLCSVPYFLWIKASAKDFHSDGSVAGLFVFVLYCGAGLLAFLIGASIMLESIKTLRQREKSGTTPYLQQSNATAKEKEKIENVGNTQSAQQDAKSLSKGQTIGYLLISTLFYFMALRLIFGYDTWSCGRKGCDIGSWIYSWGGNKGIGLSYILIGSIFFIPACLNLRRKKKSKSN